jgi:hypothetical protein
VFLPWNINFGLRLLTRLILTLTGRAYTRLVLPGSIWEDLQTGNPPSHSMLAATQVRHLRGGKTTSAIVLKQNATAKVIVNTGLKYVYMRREEMAFKVDWKC